ncbi:MAG: urea ABC transporter permease subunit UrtB [Alphaproteobacteria bacterium]|nr:urea ABC transporter permease subunit UrtB [Alphaproteobacteria bacterium]
MVHAILIQALGRLGVAAALCAALLTSPASAQDAVPKATVAELVQALAAGPDFTTKIQATQSLATTGDPRLAPILQALLDGNLYARKADNFVVIAKEQGGVLTLTDPLEEKQIGQAPAADFERVTVNNRLRTVLQTALGALQLAHPDASRRKASADALFKTPSLEMIEPLKTALTHEANAGAKRSLAIALAATELQFAETNDVRARAVATLAVYADPNVRAYLSGRIGGVAADAPAEQQELKAAMVIAVAEIERRLANWRILGNILQGISLGSVLMLAAIGLAITFGVMGIINMAHGEMVMLGAYTTYVVQMAFRQYLPEGLDYAVLVAIPAAFAVSGLVGIAMERGVIRFLYGRPLETLLATWGISLILQQAVRSIFGPTNMQVTSPPWMSGAIDLAGGVVVTYNRIWIIVFALLVFGGLILIQRRSFFGLQMRAVTQNRRMARSMGIRSGWVDALTFGLGSGIAGMAGVALSQIDNVSPNLGQSYIVDSFMVVVFGGVGNLWGTLVGAFGFGIVNKFLEPYAGAVLGKILVLVAIVLFIQWRPRGMFALKGRAVEV